MSDTYNNSKANKLNHKSNKNKIMLSSSQHPLIRLILEITFSKTT